jgi:hypothetical protein
MNTKANSPTPTAGEIARDYLLSNDYRPTCDEIGTLAAACVAQSARIAELEEALRLNTNLIEAYSRDVQRMTGEDGPTYTVASALLRARAMLAKKKGR